MFGDPLLAPGDNLKADAAPERKRRAGKFEFSVQLQTKCLDIRSLEVTHSLHKNLPLLNPVLNPL